MPKKKHFIRALQRHAALLLLAFFVAFAVVGSTTGVDPQNTIYVVVLCASCVYIPVAVFNAMLRRRTGTDMFDRMIEAFASEEVAMHEKFPMRDLDRLITKVEPSQDYQVIGYRFAGLKVVNSRVVFGSIMKTTCTFTARAKAECIAGKQTGVDGEEPPEHGSVPEQTCTCGFYSVKTLQLLKEKIDAFSKHAVLLECAYYGKVIPATQGERAEVQQVLRVWIPHHCAVVGCRRQTAGVGSGHMDESESMLLHPLCTHHLQRRQATYKLVDLRNELSVEFAFV